MRTSCSGVAALRWTRTQRRSRMGWRRATSSHMSRTSGRQRVTSVLTRRPWRAASSACSRYAAGSLALSTNPAHACVWLARVQDARDLGVTAVVQADAADAQAIVAEPAPAGPRRQPRDNARRLGGLPRRADRQRAAQRAARRARGLPVDGQHLGRHAVPLVHRGHPAGRVRRCEARQRAQTLLRREARRRAHQSELEHLDEVVLDEHAGRLAGGVLHDLHALAAATCRAVIPAERSARLLATE